MATDKHANNDAYELEMTVTVTSQNIANNTSTVSWVCKTTKSSGTGYSGSGNMSGSANVDGSVWSVSGQNWDFTGGTPKTVTWTSGSKTITHGADGTKTINWGATVTLGSSVGKATISQSLTLPRIPRGPRVRVSGTWRNTVAYVRQGGTWKIAIPYARQGGTWKVAGS